MCAHIIIIYKNQWRVRNTSQKSWADLISYEEFIFTVTKQRHIHSSLDIVLYLLFHVYDCIENVVKHVIFYLHDVKVMAKEIGFPIRKLLENTLLYLVVGQTKTRKFMLIGLETKHNVTILWHHVIWFFTRKMWGCNILFNSTNKKNHFCSFYTFFPFFFVRYYGNLPYFVSIYFSS